MAREFRRDIDLLKGIAILAVVFYHFFDLTNRSMLTSSSFFNGGFLGVDVFFIISGALITLSIVKSFDSNSFLVFDFYKRRFLRILPPLMAMVIFTYAVGYFILFPNVYHELSLESVALLKAVSNFQIAKDGGYFGLNTSEKLLLHTWYLSITLQFYIVWPLLLMLFNKVSGAKGVKYGVLILTAIMIAVSIVACKKGNGYLLTQTRVFELFFGACVALFTFEGRFRTFVRNHAVLSNLIQLLGLTVIIVSIYTVRLENGIWYVSSSLSTILGTSLVLSFFSGSTWLKCSPLELLGRYSYSLYIWHWPLFVFALRLNFDIALTDILILFVILTAFVIASYRLFEKKVYSLKSLAVAYVLIAAVSYTVKAYDGKNYLSQFMVSALSMMVNEPMDLPDEYKPATILEGKNAFVKKFGDQSREPAIFFVGDSHNEHYQYYMENINKIPVYFMVSEATMAYGNYFSNLKTVAITGFEERQVYYNFYKQMLDRLAPGSQVVLANRWDLYYNVFLLENNLKDNPDNLNKFFDALFTDFREQISLHNDLRFYIVGMGIQISPAVVNCLKTDLSGSFLSKILDDNKCRVTKDYSGDIFKEINVRLKDFADSMDNVKFIERNTLLKMPDGFYRTYSERGIPLFFDDAHFSSEGGILVGKYLMDELQKDN